MKVKVAKLANAIPSIKYISQQSVPAKVSFKLAKFINILSQELEILELARRNILEKHSKKDEDTENLVIVPEMKEAFEKQMLELFDQEIELHVEEIGINELGGISVPVNHLMALDFMFKD